MRSCALRFIGWQCRPVPVGRRKTVRHGLGSIDGYRLTRRAGKPGRRPGSSTPEPNVRPAGHAPKLSTVRARSFATEVQAVTTARTSAVVGGRGTMAEPHGASGAQCARSSSSPLCFAPASPVAIPTLVGDPEHTRSSGSTRRRSRRGRRAAALGCPFAARHDRRKVGSRATRLPSLQPATATAAPDLTDERRRSAPRPSSLPVRPTGSTP